MYFLCRPVDEGLTTFTELDTILNYERLCDLHEYLDVKGAIRAVVEKESRK